MKRLAHILHRKWLLALLAASLQGMSLPYAAETASEPAVRAALLFNFLRFTEWPATSINNLHLQLCLATNDAEVLAAMEALNARLVRNKPLLVARYRLQTDCDVIYIDSRQRWNSIVDKPAMLPHALTIGDYPGFASDGGMIEIILQEGRPRFDINLQEAKRAGLRIYPQLLQLARKLIG